MVNNDNNWARSPATKYILVTEWHLLKVQKSFGLFVNYIHNENNKKKYLANKQQKCTVNGRTKLAKIVD